MGILFLLGIMSCAPKSFEDSGRIKKGPVETSLYGDYYNRYDFYRDYYEMRPIVVIPININVWQKDDGTGNWQDTEAHRERLNTVIDFLNAHYRDVGTPSDPVEGVDSIRDTKIRFQLEGVYFYRNSQLWASAFGKTADRLDSAMCAIDSNRIKQLNIHITGYENPSSTVEGYAQFPSYELSRKHSVITFHNEAEPYNKHADFAFSKHLAHELGHVLDLRHTYGAANCHQEDPDYLDDVFGSGENAHCPHRAPRGSLWGCDPYSPDNECTNNLMGGTRDMRYLSPKQIFRMHRALSLKSIRNYVAYTLEETTKPWVISGVEKWDFDIRMYNDILIKKGGRLIVEGQVYLGDQNKIIVRKGGNLEKVGKGAVHHIKDN